MNSFTHIQEIAEASASVPDPRAAADFEPRHYPLINGEHPPPRSRDRNGRIKIEFAAAYYALNSWHARLANLRTRPDSLERRQEEVRLLQEIERLLIARDQLEDFYAPLGVIAHPVTREGYTVNLNISFGNADALGRLRSDYFTITACVPVPLPEGINFDDLPVAVEGPGIFPPDLETRTN